MDDTTGSPERGVLDLMVDFATTIVSDYSAGEAIDALVAKAPGILGVDGAGVMLEDDDGELRFVSASDETVRLIERFQIQTGEGPCVLAYETGTPTICDDLRATTPFPTFATVALEAGMAAVHSFPMRLQEAHLGAINFYRSRPGPLPHDHGARLGQTLADLATTYLYGARRSDRLALQIDALRRAIADNGVIDQAKGALRHQGELTEAAAFSALRGYARAKRMRLLDASRRLMDGAISVEDVLTGQQTQRTRVTHGRAR